jgi:hypothetical protein
MNELLFEANVTINIYCTNDFVLNRAREGVITALATECRGPTVIECFHVLSLLKHEAPPSGEVIVLVLMRSGRGFMLWDSTSDHFKPFLQRVTSEQACFVLLWDELDIDANNDRSTCAHGEHDCIDGDRVTCSLAESIRELYCRVEQKQSFPSLWKILHLRKPPLRSLCFETIVRASQTAHRFAPASVLLGAVPFDTTAQAPITVTHSADGERLPMLCDRPAMRAFLSVVPARRYFSGLLPSFLQQPTAMLVSTFISGICNDGVRTIAFSSQNQMQFKRDGDAFRRLVNRFPI